MNMSRKEVVVSNVSKEHDNPIAELVQVAAAMTVRLSLRAITAGSMQRVSWESWHLILQRV